MNEVSDRRTIDQRLVVTVPVADLRRKPVEARAAYTRDDLQESQLLFNETLLRRGEEGGWYFVEAEEQLKRVAGNAWQGYPGWVKKQYVSPVETAPGYNGVVSSRIGRLLAEPKEAASPLLFLSTGTRITVGEKHGTYYEVRATGSRPAWISVSEVSLRKPSGDSRELRDRIVRTAALFAGAPYVWGGRSMFMAGLTATVTGVDCSGLTNLAYRANNIDLPRDAHDQWSATKQIPAAALKPGDLIFLSREGRADRVHHVMLYTGHERFIEAHETGTTIRAGSFREKLGATLAELERKNCVVNGKHIYFGRVEGLGQPG